MDRLIVVKRGNLHLWIDGWMDGWIDEWMDGWRDGWMDGWMDGLIDRALFVKLIIPPSITNPYLIPPFPNHYLTCNTSACH